MHRYQYSSSFLENPETVDDSLSFDRKMSISTFSDTSLPLPSQFHQGDYVSTTITQASMQPHSYLSHSNTLRTVYLGNLPPMISYQQLLDHVCFGMIELAKIFEEKNCAFITFLDPHDAQIFFNDCQTRALVIQGREIKIGWGKNTILSETLLMAVRNGASRNILLGNLENMTIDWLECTFSSFGPVDHIELNIEKNIAFVHLNSITAAIKAVITLSMDPRLAHCRIHYGKDRCCTLTSPVRNLTNQGTYLNRGSSHGLLYNSESITDHRVGGVVSTPLMGNRTVYLGGIHPDVSTKDLCDSIRGGILQNIKYMSEKNIAFISFIEAASALSFYTRGINEGLVLKGKRVKFGWGKPTPLPHTVASAVLHLGASRNVYIGSLDDCITEEKLRQDFSEFGDIELVNMVPEKNIGFVNFTDIMSAVKAVELMRQQLQQEGVIIVGTGDYTKYKINFGKDRCGNPPRPPRGCQSPLNSMEPYDNGVNTSIPFNGASFYNSPQSTSGSTNAQLGQPTPPISPSESPTSHHHHHRIMSSLGLESDLDMDFDALKIRY